jgi:hypothetical protein
MDWIATLLTSFLGLFLLVVGTTYSLADLFLPEEE